MKRMFVRLGALGLVVVGGFFAIAQAQRIMAKPNDAGAATPAPTTPDGEPVALADSTSTSALDMPKTAPAATRDPFSGSRLLDSVSDSPPSKPAPLKPAAPAKLAAEPPTRYPAFETAEPNPLRGTMPPPPSKALPRDSQVALTSHTEEAALPAERKPAARRDPFGLQSAPAPGDVPKTVPAGETGEPMERYPTEKQRYKNTAPDAAAAVAESLAKSGAPAPLRETGIERSDEGGLPHAAPRHAADDLRTDSSAAPYRTPSHSVAPPQELPRDESLRAMTGRRSDPTALDGANHTLGAAGAPAGRSISRRDPSAARPGSRQLDGPQAPQVTVQKLAPAEIQVGAPATFQILVRNTGTIPARDVVVRDVVPEGTSLVSTTPQAQVDGADLLWSFGTLQPSEEKSLSVKLMPQAEGEIGSVASVAFQAEASARTVSTRPELLVEMTAPRQVMIGENVALSIRVSNTGTGMAAGVVLHQKLPPQLQHTAGAELEFDVGDLKPREARQVDLTLTAVAAGKVVDAVAARAQGGLTAKASAEMEVLAPALEVSLEGPRRRFLEREATYTLSVVNPGTATAKDVELVSHLPKGLKFVSANNSGQYNQQTHAVYWSLAELPQGETGAVKLVTMPIEAGDQKLVIEGRADRNISDRQEEKIEVEGLAAILFEVADVADPIEIGGETAYEIRVINQGTRAADNLQLVALLPAELKGLAAEGPTRGSVERDRVVFEPLARLAPKADTTYRIRVQGLAPGDQRVRIQLKTDDMSAPVTKEESTRVYADQ